MVAWQSGDDVFLNLTTVLRKDQGLLILYFVWLKIHTKFGDVKVIRSADRPSEVSEKFDRAFISQQSELINGPKAQI